MLFEVPKNCPCCSSVLERVGEFLVCKNHDECPQQKVGAVKRWIKKIGVLHMGDTLIETMMEKGVVKDETDLYKVDPNDIAELETDGRRIGSLAIKAFQNLHAKKKLPLHVFVGSLGLSPVIGRSMVKEVVDAGFDSLSKMTKATVQDLEPVIGPTKAVEFVRGFKKKSGIILGLILAGVEVQTISGPLSGKSFCFTGFRNAVLETELENQGATIKSSASRGLTYLVALDPNGRSTKLDAARKNGTQVIGVDDAKKMAGI